MARTVMRTVVVKLTAEETAERARQLTEVLEKADEVLEAKKAKASEYKGVLESLDAGARLLRLQISNGRERREVECTYTKDYRQGVIRFHRVGTGELVEERGMSDEERQRALTDDADIVKSPEADAAIAKIRENMMAKPKSEDPALEGAQDLLREIWGDDASDEAAEDSRGSEAAE